MAISVYAEPMAWICPVCGRPLRTSNQAHSCVTYDIDRHLGGKSPEIRDLFGLVDTYLLSLGEQSRIIQKQLVCYTRGAIYAGVRVGKEKVTLVFYLDHLVTGSPISRTFDASRNRITHEAVLRTREDLTPELKLHLAASYDLLA